jgi:hypothetical protein
MGALIPEKQQEIIKAVREEKNKSAYFGHSATDAEEDAAREVLIRIVDSSIKTKYLPEYNPVSLAVDMEWAALQYFRIRLSDLRRFGRFANHELCEPKGPEES